MEYMTTIGPISDKLFHEALAYDIHCEDSGIELEAFPMLDGTIINLNRQGKSTKWRVWLYRDGRSRITHVETENIHGINLEFHAGEHLDMRDHLVQIIQRGLI